MSASNSSSQSLYTVPAAILGGYAAAWLAPRRGLAHASVMAKVQELLIVVLIFEPPHPVPPWIWTIGLVVTPAAIIFGGYLRSRPQAAAQPAELDRSSDLHVFRTELAVEPPSAREGRGQPLRTGRLSRAPA